MKKHSRWLKLLIFCMILIFITTGCWNRRELDTLAIVMGVALDKVNTPGKVQITAQIFKPSGSQNQEGGGSAGEPYLNIRNTGDNVFDTIRGFTHKFSQKLYFQHNQVLIFSQDMAKEGVRPYVDFFLRDHETRLTVWVAVAKDKASEILEVQPQLKNLPAVEIADMIESQAFNSQTSSVKMIQFLNRLMSKTTAPIAPIIEVSGEGSEKTVLVSGTAVFKKDKLVGQFDTKETRGLLWVLGEVKSGIIDVDCPGGAGKVSLEIIRAGSKITPEIRDGRIYIKVTIKEEGNLGSQSCPEDFSSPEAIKLLEKEKKAAIESEVLAALKKAKKLNTDVFGFGDAINQKYEEQWAELESRWDEFFPHVEVALTVEAKLRRMGRITKPAYPEQE